MLDMANKYGVWRGKESSLGQSKEDYLKTIYLLSRNGKSTRITDISVKLHVSKASVVSAIHTLSRLGFVIHEKYGNVKLTVLGEQKARELNKRHEVLSFFIKDILKLPQRIAERDACNLEHYTSQETIERIVQFIEFVKKCPQEEAEWLRGFDSYVTKGAK